MNVNSSIFSDQKLIIFLYFSIFINYVCIFFDISEYLKIFFSILIAVSFFACLLKFNYRSNYIRILILLFLIICLGSPTFHSDARFIWLFNAKKIFFESGVSFLKLDEVNGLWFQSYPLLGPSLASAIANLFGYWNEIFPKIYSVILALPPLLYLNSLIEKKFNKAVFILLLVFIFEKSLLMGEMDGVLSLYFIMVSTISYKFFFERKIKLKTKNQFYFSDSEIFNNLFFIFSLIFLSLLKKESIVLILIIFFSLFFISIFNKKKNIEYKDLIIFFIGLIPLISWEIYLFREEIYLANHPAVTSIFSLNFKIILTQIFNFRDILKINSSIILNKHFIISLLFFSFIFGICYKNLNLILKNELMKPLILYSFLIIIFYMFYLNFIYLFTSWELDWHLRTSAGRTSLPLSVFISFTSLMILEKLNISLKKFN